MPCSSCGKRRKPVLATAAMHSTTIARQASIEYDGQMWTKAGTILPESDLAAEAEIADLVEKATMIETWAVIPTKNRPDELKACLASLVGQIHGAIIVDNNDQATTFDMHATNLGMDVAVIHRPGYPPNLAALYNLGLDRIYTLMDQAHIARFNVVELNDDVEVPEGWVTSLASALRATEAAAAYTDRISRTEPVFYLGSAPPNVHELMMGWAHMLRGELHLRWDEQFQWWYGDTDLDYRCRIEHGGVIAVPGNHPVHKHPSVQTFSDATLSRIAHEDGARFAAKWQGAL